MGDRESRKPLSAAFKATVAASRSSDADQPTEEARHAHQLVLEEAEGVLSSVHRKGYFRIGKGQDKLYWVRWKWTAGELAGHYTFGSGDTLGLALDQALERVWACESGKRHAHRDEGYRPKR